MSVINYFMRLVKGPMVSKIDIEIKAEQPKRKPEISEPALTILALMKSEPERFDIIPKGDTVLIIKDRVNKNSITLIAWSSFGFVRERSGMLTMDEAKAIEKAATLINESRNAAWQAARKKAKRAWLCRAYNVEAE